MSHVKTQTKVTSITTFDLRQMQSSENHYDDKLVHQINHKVILIDNSGKSFETTLLQLSVMIKALSFSNPSPGPFIDHCLNFFNKEDIQKIIANT